MELLHLFNSLCIIWHKTDPVCSCRNLWCFVIYRENDIKYLYSRTQACFLKTLNLHVTTGKFYIISVMSAAFPIFCIPCYSYHYFLLSFEYPLWLYNKNIWALYIVYAMWKYNFVHGKNSGLNFIEGYSLNLHDHTLPENAAIPKGVTDLHIHYRVREGTGKKYLE